MAHPKSNLPQFVLVIDRNAILASFAARFPSLVILYTHPIFAKFRLQSCVIPPLAAGRAHISHVSNFCQTLYSGGISATIFGKQHAREIAHRTSIFDPLHLCQLICPSVLPRAWQIQCYQIANTYRRQVLILMPEFLKFVPSS